MSFINFKHKGDFSKLTRYFEVVKSALEKTPLEQCAQMGVDALEAATPKDSGITSGSWYYKIQNDSNGVTITYHNSNINEGVPIAVILHYGHGTRNGGWVQGRDYINPALQPVFDEIAEKAWDEVTKA